ncbi:MAG: DNA translocase FtsK [candidate division Zixibacteria bacterium]|nr:DNA translocase FtsK [candidate division Zixibacteria bacterium]MDH3935815.1 DNA translocase FtsK [candidate division Zixibacteria bacterium]MDH4032839.1 DNA translocase FtsK [candidate division Zixibacteria bacterium]
MARRKKKKSTDRRKTALGVLLLLLAALLTISLVTHERLDDLRITGQVDRHLSPFELEFRNQGGMMGAYLAYITTTLVGWLAFFLPLGLVFLSLRLLTTRIAERYELNSFLLFVISLLGSMIYNIHLVIERSLMIPDDTIGGYMAERLTQLFVRLVGPMGSYVMLGGFGLILLVLYTSITPLLAVHLSLPGSTLLKRVYGAIRGPVATVLSFGWLTKLLPHGADQPDEYDKPEAHHEESRSRDAVHVDHEQSSDQLPVESPVEANEKPAKASRGTGATKPPEQVQLKSVEYNYPSVDLLNVNPQTSAAVNDDELQMTARMLKDTLETFGVGIEGTIERFPGPVITRYEFKPAAGVKVNQIVNLSDDLALALKAQRIRIIAPIPGKAAVGVEIPNRSPQMVYLREVLASPNFSDADNILPVALGKSTSGKPYVADLTKMPHLLIAGATGAGKSVCMNVLITSLLYRLHPHQVRFVLIDPKMLELSVYSGIPHLGRPVVTKPKRAEKVLTDAVTEMEKRYRKLAEASVRNIQEFNRKQKDEEQRLPYIVIFVDELADMMMSATSSKTELLITRLAQMSRAVGIHLILATQRPSVDVITGLIKANFPARIAFQVSSKVDSRTIIDANGAEKLLGRGDMLFLQTGQPEPIRIHGAYLSSEESDAIVKFIKDQGLETFTLESMSQASGEPTQAEVDFGDPLFREACEVVVRHKQGSVSLLQRRLGIGYQRAARLIDKLEQGGIVSPFDGSKARDVLVDKAFLDALFARAEPSSTIGSGQN